MATRDLKVRTKEFALGIIQFYARLPRNEVAQVLGKQLLRSGTSIGANYREACRARSPAEFVAKLGDSLKEIEETQYWLELLAESGMAANNQTKELTAEAEELNAIFTASIRTARKTGKPISQGEAGSS